MDATIDVSVMKTATDYFELEPNEKVLRDYLDHLLWKKYPIVLTDKQIYHLHGLFFSHVCKIPYEDIDEIFLKTNTNFPSELQIFDSSNKKHVFSDFLFDHDNSHIYSDGFKGFRDFIVERVLNAKRRRFPKHMRTKEETEIIKK